MWCGCAGPWWMKLRPRGRWWSVVWLGDAMKCAEGRDELRENQEKLARQASSRAVARWLPGWTAGGWFEGRIDVRGW